MAEYLAIFQGADTFDAPFNGDNVAVVAAHGAGDLLLSAVVLNGGTTPFPNGSEATFAFDPIVRKIVGTANSSTIANIAPPFGQGVPYLVQLPNNNLGGATLLGLFQKAS